MQETIDAICNEINNYFKRSVSSGDFKIVNGNISPSDFLQDGQYFRIVNSVFNDGVHQFPASDLIDEAFSGEVWAMGPPPTLIALASQIKEYAESDAAKPSPFISESFGGYSYSKASGNSDGNTWQKVFAKQLNRYRKVSGVI